MLYCIVMKKKHLDFTTFKKQALKDPKVKVEYEKLQPEYALIKEIIKSRVNKKMTQKKLAEKIGTKQSVISRIETGRGNPSVAFLKKLAQALDSRLQIRFVSY